jgi:hypothetical protein
VSISEHISNSEPQSSTPVRRPANDIGDFDVSRRSPEQIAKLFARWKAQRQQLEASASQRKPPYLKPVPPIPHGAAQTPGEAGPSAIAASEPDAVRYSASFEALLSAREPTLAQRVWNPDARLAKLGRPHPPRRGSRAKWLLAGAASVVAVAAVAGGALWQQSVGQPGWTQAGHKPATNHSLIATPAIATPAEAAVAPAYPMDIPMAEPFVAKATASRLADWPMRQAVDLALMKAAPVTETAHLPLMPQLKPPVPVVRTASKAAAKPAAAQPEAEPNEAPVARVELPLVPRVTTATVSVPVAPATEPRNDDSRSNVITGRGNDKENFTFGTNGRVASSSSRPAGASGSGGSSAPGSGSAGGSTGGSGDPGSGTGGDPGGPGSGTGGDPGGGTGGSGSGGGNTGGGDAGGGDTGGGDTGGGDTGGGDPGGGSGGDAGGGDSGGGDSDGGDSGGGDAGGGGDSGEGDSGGGDSGGDGSGGGESGESGEGGSDDGGGIGGAIGGALGGIGDAVGGALGGGKGDADGDKDKDKGKDRDKSD